MHYSLRQYRDEAQSHSHSDFHQIIISDLGTLELEVEGCGGEVCGRRMAFVEAGKNHAYRAEGLNRFFVLDVDADLASQTGIEALWAEHGRAATYLDVRHDQQAGLMGLLGGLSTRDRGRLPANAGEMSQQDDCDEEWLVAAVRQILATSRKADLFRDVSAQNLPVRLSRVMAWAEARLGEDITITDLAGVASQSESSLFAAFQRHLGTSPIRWLTEQRLQMAMALLRDPDFDLSISELSGVVGFTDQSAFSRAFSRRFGRAPVSLKR